MENKEFGVILNNIVVDRLNDIALNIKYVINANAHPIDDKCVNYIMYEDLNELIEIRKRLKIITHKLKNKLDKNSLNLIRI